MSIENSNFYCLGVDKPLREVKDSRTIKFIEALRKFKYAKYVRCFEINGKEGVEFDIEPETYSKSPFEIKKTERTCVIFNDDSICPSVQALRKDFPRELLHINLTPIDKPAELCIYGENYSLVKLDLTPELFLRRIYLWYCRASEGTSHLANQPLEPFLFSDMIFIVGEEIYDNQEIYLATQTASDIIFRLHSIKEYSEKAKKYPDKALIPLSIKSGKWHSRVIYKTPRTIGELAELLKQVDIDLLSWMRPLLISIVDNIYKDKNKLLSYGIIIILSLPKTRTVGGDTETIDNYAFLVTRPISEICEKFNIIAKNNGQYGRILSSEYNQDMLNGIAIEGVAKVINKFDRLIASRMAGLSEIIKDKFTAIGVGALGSQVLNNLTRQGIGQWNIVDMDILLPHNHSRYAYSPSYETMSKADLVSNEIAFLLNDNNASKSFKIDILAEIEGSLYKELTDVKRIFDFSVNKAVSRKLSVLKSNTPITSAFLTHKGKYLVILSEDDKRTIRLDDIETQLAVLCFLIPALNKVLAIDDKQETIRYSGACSDITTILPSEIVSIHGGIATSFIKNGIKDNHSVITVWEYISLDATVKSYQLKTVDVFSCMTGGWNVRISTQALDLIKCYREGKLPNETGGVLLGAYDTCNKIIYVGHALSSPEDSIEWPYCYIRGCKNLEEMIKSIKEKTGNHLGYIGEWHSHPNNEKPSVDDIKALRWVAQELSDDGYPALMIIQGKHGLPTVLLDQI